MMCKEIISSLKNEILTLTALNELYKRDNVTNLLQSIDFNSSYDHQRIKTLNTGVSFGIMLLTINDIHNMNEKFGYGYGDGYILKQVSLVSNCINNLNITTVDDFYRLSGNLFVIIVEFEELSALYECVNSIKAISVQKERVTPTLLNSLQDGYSNTMVKYLGDKLFNIKKLLKRRKHD